MSERIVSPKTNEYKRTLPVLAWSVRAILDYGKHKSSKTDANLTLHFTLQGKFTYKETTRSFTIYRREIYRLLNAPKNAFDQLIFELPCLMGLRSREIATWKLEYIDFQQGETLVLDAKKHKLLSIPLNVHIAKLAMEVACDRNEGYVFRNRSRAYRGRTKPISNNAIWNIWKKYAYTLNLYPDPNDYYPLLGRRFFAGEFIRKLGLEHVFTLSRIMRHSDPKQTLDYVNHIIFAEDVRRDYDNFQTQVLSDMLKVKP